MLCKLSFVSLGPGHTCTATCRRMPCNWKNAATNATTMRSNMHVFECRSIDDWSATTILKIRWPVRSLTVGRLIAKSLEMDYNWSATGWRMVGYKSAMGWRLTIDQAISCVGVIINKALTNCYTMAITISIMPYCLFCGYFPVMIYVD